MTDPIHLVCPHCAAVNRVQTAHLRSAPNCGKCHQPLFTGAPIELDEAAFDKHLLRGQLPLLVDFWAPWCGPCRTMAPAYAQAARELEPEFRIAKVNTEAHPTLGSRYNVRSIPTLALFAGGREVARQAGAMSASDIVRWTLAASAR